MRVADGVDDYYDVIHRKTWARRVAGVLTGATMFGICGAIGGAAAAYLPYALGLAAAAPVATGVLSTMAICAAATAFIGVAIAADVGANAAAVAAGLEEKERREKIDKGSAPALQQEAKAKAPEGFLSLFNFKWMAISVVGFAAFGALCGLSDVTAPLMSKVLGIPSGGAAGAIAGATLCGMFGVTLGIKFAMISNKFSNFYMGLITGKAFEKAKEVPEPEVVPTPELSPEAPERARPRFANQERHCVLQTLLGKSDVPAAALPMR